MNGVFERGCGRDQLAISERINCDMKAHCTPGISGLIGMVLRTRFNGDTSPLKGSCRDTWVYLHSPQ